MDTLNPPPNAINSPANLLVRARLGDGAALGKLLERYRDYLRLLAEVQIGRRLQGKVDASDVVQESFLEAHRDFGKLRATSEGELVAWLRQILATNLANTIRRYLGTQRRNIRLEQELRIQLEDSSQLIDQNLVASNASPSDQVSQHERAVRLADALGQMSQNQRLVIILRHFEEMTFPEIAIRMGQSVAGVKKLWARAIIRLRGLIGESP